MAFYLKGIGDTVTRTNEILPALDARINKFLVGHTAGVIKNEFYEFTAQTIDRGIVIKSGMMVAYGYFAMTDTDVQFNFMTPSNTMYVQVYAEVNLSVVPNRFEIKTTTMSANTIFNPQQDNLRQIPNGKYQMPLWQVTLTNNSVILTDKRSFITKPSDAVTAENYTENGNIASQFALKAPLASPALTGAPTAPTAGQSVNNTQIATTAYVRKAVTDAKNIISGTISMASGHSAESNFIKRQVNFVYGQIWGLTGCRATGETKTFTIGNVGANFKPKEEVHIGLHIAESTEGYHLILPTYGAGTATGVIKTNGDIVITLGAAEMNDDTHQIVAARVFFGYEIT
jgi:hypothetical protein